MTPSPLLLTGELVASDSVLLDVPTTEVWQLSIRWMAEDGTTVKAGDRVLELDNSSFVQGLEQKKLTVKETETGLRTFKDLADLDLLVKEHTLEQQRIALEKAQTLASVPADLLPARTAQSRKLDVERAQVDVEKAVTDLATAKAAASLDLRVKQIELDKAKRAVQTSQDAIDNLVMKAPREGVALVGIHPWEDRPFQIGDMVQPGFTVITMPDLSKAMYVRADLSDVDDGRVTQGMTATCTLDAYPREPLPCKVTDVSPVAREIKHDSLRRAFTVKIALEAKDQNKLRPGMSVKVEIAGTAP